MHKVSHFSTATRLIFSPPFPGGGKTVDLACFKNGHKLAVEIETSSSYEVYNVKKCLKAGFDEVRTIRV